MFTPTPIPTEAMLQVTAHHQEPPTPTPLTFRDGRGQGGLAMVYMADGTHVHMGFVTHIGLLGLPSQATAQDGQCLSLQRPQKTLQ